MLKRVAEAATRLPGEDGRAVRAAADALARRPLDAPWRAFEDALRFAEPPTFYDTPEAWTVPEPALRDEEARAALAMLAVRALRRGVLDAASRAAGSGRVQGSLPGYEAELLSERWRGLLRYRDAGWRHVEAVRGMLPELAAAERPDAALAERLLQSGGAPAWWGLREHELRAASIFGHRDAPASSPQDDAQGAVERAREMLAGALGVSPRRILIVVTVP